MRSSDIDMVLLKCEQDRVFRLKRQMCVIWLKTLCLVSLQKLFKSGVARAGVNDVRKSEIFSYIPSAC